MMWQEAEVCGSKANGGLKKAEEAQTELPSFGKPCLCYSQSSATYCRPTSSKELT